VHSENFWYHIPSVQDINSELLCSNLNCRDFFVCWGSAEVVVRDVSFLALANIVARFGEKLINVVLQLKRMQCVSIYTDVQRIGASPHPTRRQPASH
jgi:hypothetical protein